MNAIVEKIILILAAIGAINWGLEAFDYGLVGLILGEGTIATVVYVIIGLCGIWALIKIIKK